MIATTDVDEATKDVDYAIMVGGFPRKAGMERKDVMSKNVSIYKSQASALEKNASKDVKACPAREGAEGLGGDPAGSTESACASALLVPE